MPGIDLKKFRNISKTKEKKILFVGRISEQKNIEDIIKIARMLPYKFWIIGGGQTTIIKKLKRKSPNNIIWLGEVKNEDLIKFYSRASILILTSHWESFGITIIEAMACGAVPIVYDVIPKGIINNGFNGFVVKKYDIQSMVRKINLLMNDKIIFNFMSKKAIQKCRNNFDINEYHQKIERVLCES